MWLPPHNFIRWQGKNKNDISKVEFDEFNIVGSSIYICNWVIFLDTPTNDFVLFIFFRCACFESNESEW